MSAPTIRHIVGVVRLAGPDGCTAEYVAKVSGASLQAVQKALALQIQESLIEPFAYVAGGATFYRMRDSK